MLQHTLEIGSIFCIQTHINHYQGTKLGEVCDVDDMLIDVCLGEKRKKHTSTSNPVLCSKRQRLQSETPAGRPNELPARLALSEGCHGWLRITEMVSINCQTNISKLVFKAFS